MLPGDISTTQDIGVTQGTAFACSPLLLRSASTGCEFQRAAYLSCIRPSLTSDIRLYSEYITNTEHLTHYELHVVSVRTAQ